MSKYHQARARNPIATTPFFTRRTRMPSQRRVRVFGLLIFLFVIVILFWSSSTSPGQGLRTGDDFYKKTVNALDKNGGTTGQDKVAAGSGKGKGKVAGAGKDDEDDEKVAKAMSQRLKEAAQIAKDKANAKAPKPDPPSSVVGVGSAAEGSREKGVAGRKKFVTEGEKQEVVKEEEEEVETPERRAARIELKKILKMAPIIIFSKSYCPHSRRAKGILLEKYIIDPKPYVVELDQHEIGQDLQSLLGDLTGRKTVPNTLVNGVSIGGGDDVAELDVNKKLMDKINELGAKKILAIKERPVEAPQAEAKAAADEHEAHKEHGLR